MTLRMIWSFGNAWGGLFYETRIWLGRWGQYVGLFVTILGFTPIGTPMINDGFSLAVRWYPQ